MSNNHVRVISTSDFHYHQQDTNEWCGATCVQMLVHFVRHDIAPSDQDMLRTEVENLADALEPDTIWFAAPDGIEAALNALAPLPGGSFQLIARDSEEAISRNIAWHIEQHGVPAIALVYGMRHWLVVRGFTSTHPPTGPDDTGYDIISFDLYDPWPPVPAPESALLPPPHTDGAEGDDHCGSGSERGILLNNVAYDGWRLTGGVLGSGYMTGVPSDSGSIWHDKFVAICDPPDRDASRDDYVQGAMPGDGGNRSGANEPPPANGPKNGSKVISEDEAAKRAVAGLQEYGLLERDEWKAVLAGAVIARPALVGTPKEGDPHYFVVPLRVGNKAPAAVRVDARTGAYLHAVATPDRSRDVARIMSFHDVVEGIIGEEFDFDGERVTLRAEDVAQDAPLVWQPCLESFSPFFPFYRVALKRGIPEVEHIVYIRAYDGRPFTHLTQNVAGA